MLKKMGHMGQEVLAELSKLKKRLKHTTELVRTPTLRHSHGRPHRTHGRVRSHLSPIVQAFSSE
jgi:hypothetical protein